MQREYVEAGAALVALDGQCAGFVLHGEIVPHRTRAIADEVERGRKAFSLKEFMKEIVEGALPRTDPSGRDPRSCTVANEPSRQVAAASRTVTFCRPPRVHTFSRRAYGPRASFRESWRYQRKVSSCIHVYEKIRTTSQLNKLFSRSRRYLSNRGHMSLHVPTMVIASSRRFGTCGSSILPSAIAVFLSTSRALTS